MMIIKNARINNYNYMTLINITVHTTIKKETNRI